MRKVKCLKGHFFDLDRYVCCPYCGSPVDGQSIKSIEPKYDYAQDLPQSQVEETDQTEILQETPEISNPDNGKKKWWFFKAKEEKEEKKEQPAPVPEEIKPYEPPYDPIINRPQELQTPPTPEDLVRPQKEEPEHLKEIEEINNKVDALPPTVAKYDLKEKTEPPTGWIVCVKGAEQGHAFPCREGKTRIGRNDQCNIRLVNDISITREPHAIIHYDPMNRIFFLQCGSGDGIVYLNGEYIMDTKPLNAYDKITLGKAEFVFVPLCGEKFSWDEYISEGDR